MFYRLPNFLDLFGSADPLSKRRKTVCGRWRMNMNMKINISNFTLTEMEDFFVGLGEQKFRAKQVFQWLHKGVDKFEEMTVLSKALRNKLDDLAMIEQLDIVQVQISKADGTRKYLLKLMDENFIESVLMKYKFGNTLCISSQAGCRMGCRFCASGKDGLSRDLHPAEMVGQIHAAEKESGEKVGNVVIMGTGEPLDNYEHLAKFLEIAHHPEGLNLGWRSITVSTCGLIPQMERFAREFPQVNLAISLHAPDDERRSQMMPINSRYPLDMLLSACQQYAKQTGRRITFEYALVQGVNDGVADAEHLATKVKGINCHINLIPLNQVDEKGYLGTNRKQAEVFQQTLEKRRIPSTIRRTLGSDIDGACGQLRLRHSHKEAEV